MSIRLDELTPEQERLVLDLYTSGYALARVRQKSGLDISLSTIGSLIRKHDKLRHWNPDEGTARTQSSNGHPPFS